MQMYNKAEEFISNTTLKLQEWEDLGHDKCYRTEEYDVRLCHEDCKKREKGDFAKKCKKDGGLFKCCVRYEITSTRELCGTRTKWYQHQKLLM